ncbi:MAG: hypothetical protein MJZ93_01365 [Paludibacteraceae bacterium]|nr:hypothetical protein [Paludibacteraceae bacterium]MCQ2329190.1 hypothetical protein [Paludibacteraceae bacterium]
MKKIFMVAMALIIACSTCFAAGDSDQKEIRKERNEIRKLAKKELDARVSKVVKKEAKRLKKEGWLVKPGALPLEKQLERVYLMQYEYDESLYPKYIMGEASSVGENYDAAKTAATSLAITNLAGQIQTEVTALVENTVGNEQLSAEEAASITKSVMSSKNLISQSIGRVMTVMECYRINSKNNNEVLVRIAYNGEMAKEAAKKAVRASLEEKGEELHDQLDKVLGFDK